MAASLRRAGVCIYAAVYLNLVVVHFLAWTQRFLLKRNRQSVRFLSLSTTFLSYELLLLVAFRCIPCLTIFRRPNRVRYHFCILIIGPLWQKSIHGSNSQKTQSHYWRVVPLPDPWSCYGVHCGFSVLICKCRPCPKTSLPLGTNSRLYIMKYGFIYPNEIEFRHLLVLRTTVPLLLSAFLCMKTPQFRQTTLANL